MALARGLELAADPQWLRLLAYERRAFWPGRTGRVQSPGFYLHEDGSADPEAELRATLEALYAPVVPGAAGAHAACQFPARRSFLVERLGLRLRGQPLPDPACPAYQAWRDRLDTERVVLVYADAYMGNPASMFGHTLLRLDSRADLQRPLTAYSVNHAARAGGDSGVLFAMRGVLGSYPGLYAVVPYYYKVNQYTRMEQRDLWVYELNLDEAAIDRLLAHLWELDGAAMPYYFFLHNCSYRLLTLLEVADPSLTLRGDFGLWAIPSDTIRAVTAEAGLVREVRYRPSRRRVLDHMLGDLAHERAEQARALARGELAPDDEAIAALPEAEQARLLETAEAYLAQLGHVTDVGDEGRRRRHTLLAARAHVDGPSIAPPPRPEQRPDEGHGTGRAGLGLGTYGGVGYAELQWRAAYHDLLDPPGGYLRGAQVSFLSIAARAYEHGSEPRDGREPEGGVALERLQLLGARSLAPRNRPFPGWAWGAGVGVERMRDADGERPLMAHLEADFGPAQTEEVRGTVVHFHGNAQNISTHIAAVWWLPRHGFRVFAFDYRGYGRSAGEPSFAGVHRDARAALEAVTEREAVQPEQLLILGQSLGASIAITALARWEGEEPAGIVAESAFASYRGIARDKLGALWLTWPFQYPLSWLIGDAYAPIDHVADLAPTPLLLVVDGDDRVIPPGHGERLYEAANEPRYLWRIEGARHSAALADDRVRYRLLQTFRGWLADEPEAAARPPEGPWRKDPPRP